MTRTQIPAFSATSSRIISRGDVIFDDLQLPPRLLAAIFRVDIYRERSLGGSNIAFKKLGRTALNHDRIISHDCPPLKRVYASCVSRGSTRSTGKIVRHPPPPPRRFSHFFASEAKFLNNEEDRNSLLERRGGEFPEKLVEMYESPSEIRFPFTTSVYAALKTMRTRLQVVTSTGVFFLFFLFFFTVHISSEPSSETTES